MSKREFTLAYGKKEIKFKLDEKNLLGVLLPEKITPEEDEKTIIENALKNPVKSAPLAEIVSPKSEVAIITSDITRSTPSSKMLPPLLNELERAGVKRKNIKIIFALGAHRKHTEEEKKYLVGEKIYENYRCIDHEKENCVSLGKTKSGIPVEIFKEVNRADLQDTQVAQNL